MTYTEIPIWTLYIVIPLMIIGIICIILLLIHAISYPFEKLQRLDDGQNDVIELLTEIKEILREKK